MLEPLYRLRRAMEPCKNRWPIEKLEQAVMAGFKDSRGYAFDLKKPESFTEKIQWYKLYYRFPRMERVVDKFLFKNYIAEKLGQGYTIPLYGVWSSVKALEEDWDNLPEEFCLKSTVQSDGKFIKMIHNRSKIPFNDIKDELGAWIKEKNTLINSYCGAYYNAKPRVIAEAYIDSLSKAIDYKFFCFNGEPYCIYVSSYDTSSEKHFDTITFFDCEWNKLSVKLGGAPNQEGLKKPSHFDQMMAISKKLSQDFPFVRVDFFEDNSFLYVAELTLYPSGGLLEFDPPEFDKELGRMFVLPTL